MPVGIGSVHGGRDRCDRVLWAAISASEPQEHDRRVRQRIWQLRQQAAEASARSRPSTDIGEVTSRPLRFSTSTSIPAPRGWLELSMRPEQTMQLEKAKNEKRH